MSTARRGDDMSTGASAQRIVVSGVVDCAAVGSVADAVRGELARGDLVEVDVRGVERWEGAALGALAACARLGSGVEIRMDGRRSAGAGPVLAAGPAPVR